MKRFLFIVLFILVCLSVFSKRKHKEIVYQKYFSTYIGGKIEYVLPDRTRIDILTDKYAIEVDFANKWAEAIGQSLYYAECMNVLPAVMLIIEDRKDARYLKRLLVVCKKYKIKVYIINELFYIKEITY